VRFLSTGTQAQDVLAVPHLLPFTPNRHRPVRITEIEIFRVTHHKLAVSHQLRRCIRTRIAILISGTQVKHVLQIAQGKTGHTAVVIGLSPATG
jgi:hypothetical protein